MFTGWFCFIVIHLNEQIMSYNVYARTCDGRNELCRENLNVDDACDFVVANEAHYVSLGYEYLIALPY